MFFRILNWLYSRPSQGRRYDDSKDIQILQAVADDTISDAFHGIRVLP